MPRTKRSDLDELLDRFAAMDAEERASILASLYAADRVLGRQERARGGKAAPSPQPMLDGMTELGERAANNAATAEGL